MQAADIHSPGAVAAPPQPAGGSSATAAGAAVAAVKLETLSAAVLAAGLLAAAGTSSRGVAQWGKPDEQHPQDGKAPAVSSKGRGSKGKRAECSHCSGRTKDGKWGRDPVTGERLCSACHLYQIRNGELPDEHTLERRERQRHEAPPWKRASQQRRRQRPTWADESDDEAGEQPGLKRQRQQQPDVDAAGLAGSSAPPPPSGPPAAPMPPPAAEQQQHAHEQQPMQQPAAQQEQPAQPQQSLGALLLDATEQPAAAGIGLTTDLASALVALLLLQPGQADGQPAAAATAGTALPASGHSSEPPADEQPQQGGRVRESRCAHCRSSETAGLWRAHPATAARLCEACYSYQLINQGFLPDDRTLRRRQQVRTAQAELDENRQQRRQCSHCQSGETSGDWRRHPATGAWLCNACGVYQSRHQGQLPDARSLELRARLQVALASKKEGRPQWQCSHCGISKGRWRKHPITGARLCNACGTYELKNHFYLPGDKPSQHQEQQQQQQHQEQQQQQQASAAPADGEEGEGSADQLRPASLPASLTAADRRSFGDGGKEGDPSDEESGEQRGAKQQRQQHPELDTADRAGSSACPPPSSRPAAPAAPPNDDLLHEHMQRPAAQPEQPVQPPPMLTTLLLDAAEQPAAAAAGLTVELVSAFIALLPVPPDQADSLRRLLKSRLYSGAATLMSVALRLAGLPLPGAPGATS